jgi:hypothetical protein
LNGQLDLGAEAMVFSVLMSAGWSLFKDHKEACLEASVTDGRLSVDIEDREEGDTVSVTATSSDGIRYRGDYRYREGSQSNGEVSLERHKGPRGDVFKGVWKEAGGSGGELIINLEQVG